MSDGNKHAILSPSSADRWMVCPGSVLMEQGIPDVESEYSKEGTMAHELATLMLNNPVRVLTKAEIENVGNFDYENQGEYVHNYVYEVHKLSEGHTLLVEQRLPIGHITLEEDAEGTSDATIIHTDGLTIEVNDLKFGMGVKVYAKRNRQMMLYALGAVHQFEALGDFQKIVMRIHQPRLNHLDEWECSRDELEEFASEVKFRADFIWRLVRGKVDFKPDQDLVPTEKGCMWCKAKAICPAYAQQVINIVAGDFMDLTKNPVAKLSKAARNIDKIDNKKLAWFMQNLGLIEDWAKGVRARVEAELFAGHEVPGFKLVEGKKGNRKWDDEDLVEAKMKKLKLASKDMYVTEIISVAKAEKLLKKEPKKWEALLGFISQTEGKPSVAPSIDPRSGLLVGAIENDFDVIKED